MRLFALIAVAAPLLMIAAPVFGDWQPVESAKGYRMERIEFEKGARPGQLYYEQNPVRDDLPSVLAIGPAGEIYVIEPKPGRVQAFSADGKPLSALAPPDVKGAAHFVNVFPVGANRAKVLLYLKGGRGEPPRYAWFTLHSDTGSIADYAPLALPPGEGPVAMSFLDRQGFLWLLGNRWTVFAPDGKSVAGAVAQDGTYVDANGLLYVPGNALRLFDRQGKERASLKFDAENPVDVRGGELSTLLYGLEASLLQDKGRALRERSNSLVLLRFERQAQLLKVARLALQPTILSYPSQNPDFMVPVQLYLPELSTLRGNYFYIMAHSKDKYWIDRVDLSPWMPRTVR